MAQEELRIPEHFWFQIEDGKNKSPLIFSLTSAYDYISEHDFSPCAVLYWGVLINTKTSEYNSQKDFVSRGGMFLFDFLEVCSRG